MPAATKFLLTFIDAVRDIPIQDFPYRLVPIHEKLLVLTSVFEVLLAFYIDPQITIKKQLSLFSEASHSLFYLYHCNKNVLPNQLYHDLQSTFLDALFCCAKSKVFFPDKPLYLVLNGTDPLEPIFGILRMKNKNASMGYRMMTHCISSMTKCDELLTMAHPDWSKRLRLSGRLCLDYSSPKD